MDDISDYTSQTIGSGISCCPVQAGVSFHCKNLQAFILQSHAKSIATCTLVVYTHSDQHLIPDPSTVIPIPVANGSGISRKVLAFRIGRFLFPTDPRSDALDCCRVLHRIRDQWPVRPLRRHTRIEPSQNSVSHKSHRSQSSNQISSQPSTIVLRPLIDLVRNKSTKITTQGSVRVCVSYCCKVLHTTRSCPETVIKAHISGALITTI